MGSACFYITEGSTRTREAKLWERVKTPQPAPSEFYSATDVEASQGPAISPALFALAAESAADERSAPRPGLALLAGRVGEHLHGAGLPRAGQYRGRLRPFPVHQPDFLSFPLKSIACYPPLPLLRTNHALLRPMARALTSIPPHSSVRHTAGSRAAKTDSCRTNLITPESGHSGCPAVIPRVIRAERSAPAAASFVPLLLGSCGQETQYPLNSAQRPKLSNLSFVWDSYVLYTCGNTRSPGNGRSTSRHSGAMGV